MITKRKLLEKLEAEILKHEAEGWKYGDMIGIARRYEYSQDNIYRIRRRLRKNAKDNPDRTR